MAFDFNDFNDDGLSESFVEWLVDEQAIDVSISLNKMWDYYTNRMSPLAVTSINSATNETSRSYVQAQEVGLPMRITGIARNEFSDATSGKTVGDIHRKEVVIQNDISWRINAMVDFLFGKGVQIVSKAKDVSMRNEIDTIIKKVIQANGGISFLQDMAVLGSVYGFVDCIIRPSDFITLHTHMYESSATTIKKNLDFEKILSLASETQLELIDAPRAMPILDERDYRKINYYVQHFNEQKNSVKQTGNFLRSIIGRNNNTAGRETISVTEIISADMWQRYENKMLVAQGNNIFSRVPVVHIQNIAQPLYYEGLGDVEALIPLQDELNTRLSDRANRITFQSFKMYLAKGIENLENRTVAPGRLWCTDNTDASIESFGGNSQMPSEDTHIMEIRQALDKTSGVTPVVAGVLQGKVGNLSSAVALKMTLMGTLSKTDRKRQTYGQGLKEIATMVMEMLDTAGIYKNNASDREFDIIFPSPLPENTLEKLNEAKLKTELGVPKETVLRELGYETK